MAGVRRVTALRPLHAEALWMGAAGLVVAVALGGLLLQDSRYFWYGDTPAAYYGWWYHLGDLVRHGHWSTIDPHAWAAGNFAAEGQWGLWSPLTIAIGLAATVAPNTLVLATLVKIGLAVVAALGVFRLVRSYHGSPVVALVAAVAAPMGGMTQYLDLPSWVAAETIWALLPWVWWALRRTMLLGANPLPVLALGYLEISVGYVFGTIMLVVVLASCLLDALLARGRAAFLRVLAAGVLLGLVALTVYLPGVLTASVTARSSTISGFGGKFTTDPLALFTSLLPTAALSEGTNSVEPYMYVVWLLPMVLWLDWRRVRAGWRPLAGLLVVLVFTVAVVEGPSQVGPLRWPVRMEPFLVEAVVVALAVAWSRFGLRRPSRRRLWWSLGWVGASGVVSLLRAPSHWDAHLVGVLVVGAGLAAVWRLVRDGDTVGVAACAAAFTVAGLAVQHGFYGTPPSPQRNAPTSLASYRTPLAGAVGDVLQVGRSDLLLQSEPHFRGDLLLGSAWYLNPHSVQSTYTAINFGSYQQRYCTYYQGSSCARLLATLFSREPTTGRRRVDLLGVSTLLLIRADFPRHTLHHPRPGWRVAATTPNTVLWVRRHPVPGAGDVAWSSRGTAVTHVHASSGGTSFRVSAVPAAGGTVVLKLLDWPGYSTDVGSLVEPVDGYLVTVRLPAGSTGRVVHVDFHPPGWHLELAAWALALLGGAGWSAVAEVRRRRRAHGRSCDAAAAGDSARK
jgi:hypothetical protein